MSRTFELNTEEIRKINDELDKKVFKFENFSKYYTEEDYRLIKNSEVGKNLLRSIYVLDLIEEKGVDNLYINERITLTQIGVAAVFSGDLICGGGFIAATYGAYSLMTGAVVLGKGSALVVGGFVSMFVGAQIGIAGIKIIESDHI